MAARKSAAESHGGPESEAELHHGITLRGSERRGIARFYHDAIADGAIDFEAPFGLSDDPVAGIPDRIRIGPVLRQLPGDPEDAEIPRMWRVEVTDPDAPERLRSKIIYLANDEVPRSQWPTYDRSPADSSVDAPSTMMPNRQLDRETADDLIGYLRGLPYADTLRELVPESPDRPDESPEP